MPVIPSKSKSTPQKLESFLALFHPVPQSWLETNGKQHKTKSRRITSELEPLPCTSFAELTDAWSIAHKWREVMADVLSIMLSVAISTEQVGDQLFLKVIGDAGTGKTRFCDAMLVSKSCYPLEHLTGFHSGWKGGDESGKDYSLLSRINRKTMITPEGDVLISSPQFNQIMSQQRRIFDGTSGASYKNMEEDQRYTGLRTPWIIAGTPAILDADQSRLGDRFLKIYVDPPDDAERKEILRRVGRAALNAVRLKSIENDAEGQMTEELCTAYRLTGGYVDWLKANVNLLETVECSDESLDRCATLAEFTASMRAAQPKDDHPTVELPTRLNHQFVRMAACNAIVSNKTEVDYDVMRRIQKVAVDTARGPTMTLTHALAKSPYGIEARGMHLATHLNEDRCRGLVRFLSHIDVVQRYTGPMPTGQRATGVRYELTPKMRQLYREVIGNE